MELRQNSSSNQDLALMSYDDPRPPSSSRVPLCNTSAAGRSARSNQTTRSQTDSPPEAPTAQPPTTSLQIPSPRNHKLTAESEGNWGGKREGWYRRKKSGGHKKGRNKCNIWMNISFSPSLLFVIRSLFAPFTHPPLPRRRRQSELQRAAPSSPSKQPNTSAIC